MHLSRRGQRLEAWLVEEESGYNFSATGGVVLFNPCNIFNARSRFLRLPPIRLSLFPSSLRLLVSSSTRLCSREYISMHFPGQLALSLARPFPSSPSYARFNYQLFRVSQEFALAPPPPPRRHCFLSCVFFPLFLSRSSPCTFSPFTCSHAALSTRLMATRINTVARLISSIVD